MSQLFTNNAATVLATAKAAGATTMVVQAGTGARFPTLAAGDFFELTLFKIADGLEAAYEIVKVTARSIDTFTIVGAQQGTSPTAFGVGDQVSLRVTAGWLNKATTDIESKAPIASPTFTGTPAVPTAPNYIKGSTQAANSNYALLMGLRYGLGSSIVANRTMTFGEAGTWFQVDAVVTVTLPAVALMNTYHSAGATFTFAAGQPFTLAAGAGANILGMDKTSAATISVLRGECITVACNESAVWYVIIHSTSRMTNATFFAPLASPTFSGTVSGVTKAMVGLGNVDNTADVNKPVSTAQQTALDFKAPLASPTFTGTVAGITKAMVGLGNADNTADTSKPVSAAQQSALDLKAPLASPTFSGTVSGITKAMVGLGNVDNTADVNKPVSTAQQTALDFKAPLASPTFTGTVSGITKTMVGLGNVDNTADANKPVSAAQQTALNLKAPLANPTFTGTVSGITKAMVGLSNVDNTADVNKPVSTAQQTALDLKAALNGDVAQNFNVASVNDSFIGGMKNRIINGCFRINQRGLTASQTAPLSGYVIDRWNFDSSVASKYSTGLNSYGWSKAPGHANYLTFGGLSASVAAAADRYMAQQPIEGNNIHDLQYGTANAKACTLSFWTRSTTVGSHSGAIYNPTANTSFPFSFSIPVAGTWTQIKVSIPGDTANAFDTGIGAGLCVRFNLGSGTNYLRTAGSWQAGNFTGVTGSVSTLLANTGIGFTGVQFEVGAATPFSYRSVSEELAICRRYYEAGEAPYMFIGNTNVYAVAAGDNVRFAVQKRVMPSLILSNWVYYSGGVNAAFTPAAGAVSTTQFNFSGSGMTNWNGWAGEGTWSASAEM